MTNIGIDVGSTFTKYCVLSEDGATFTTERTPVYQREYFADKLKELRCEQPKCRVVSCGYGKRNIESIKSVTELSALAVGLNSVAPNCTVALDIGGQDTKLIRQQEGKLKEFFVNDRCAAGSGMFLTNVLHTLGVPFDSLVLNDTDSGIKLSNTCAVFSGSEIVEFIADNIPPMEIIKAVLRQIFTQALALQSKLDCGRSIALCGGFAHIPGIKSFAENLLNIEVIIPDFAAYLSALGCAIIAKGRK